MANDLDGGKREGERERDRNGGKDGEQDHHNEINCGIGAIPYKTKR